ncbi:hypothetical protein CPC08DRAFT_494051 [Agrocybe pediades]|nr:hypothetical protein CPC08DRAFT_494051 [Agrocybe pediades]
MSSSPHAPNFSNTLGAVLIGVIIACCLFGIITIQAYTYSLRFPNDRRILKVVVLVIWLSELGHLLCFCQATYFMIVSSYGDLSVFLYLPRAIGISTFFSGIIGPTAQVFFAKRVHVVSGKLVIPLICVMLSMIRSTLSFMTMSRALKPVLLSEFAENVKVQIPTLLAVGTTVDIILTSTLLYYLKGKAKKTFTLDFTLLWIFQTGLTTCIIGLTMMITFLMSPHTFVWMGIFAFYGRTFSCALLASLNGRVFQPETNIIRLQTTNKRSPSSATTYVIDQEISCSGEVDGLGESTQEEKDRKLEQVRADDSHLKQTWSVGG